MLILLFIFALIRHLNGAPTAIPPLPVCGPTDLYIRDNPIHRHLTSRTVNDIVVSCLATIFACTWKAIHPNIPSPCHSGWEKLKRQVATTIYAILAPELTTAWALTQHLAARRIAKMYNNEEIDKRSWIVRSIEGVEAWFSGEPLQDVIRWLYRELVEGMKGWFRRHPAPPVAKEGDTVKWTITHGFFIQMGGFMLCEGGKQLKPLNQVDDLKARVTRKEIDAPRITEGEIEDRSKGDGFTKAIVVFQTTWFIAQCIVRWSSRLPVTELEILTLGFAALNGVTYVLWWHKPQSVRLPAYLEKKGTAESMTEERGEVMVREQGRARDEDSDTSMGVAPGQVEVTAGGDETRGQGDDGVDERQSQVAGRVRTVVEALQSLEYNMLRSIFTFIRYRFGLFFKIEEDQLHVPMFHSAEADFNTVVIASSAIASIFGLIHFIPAFFLDFPSRPEMFLWRISAGIITVQPVLTFTFIFKVDGDTPINALLMSIQAFDGALVPYYIIARIALIILAFLSLRTVHGDALNTVDWISFIPHL